MRLAAYRNGSERIRQAWPGFLGRRAEWMKQQRRHGTAAEKVAENILQDLLTNVLDWSRGDLNNQVGYADLLLTQLGIRRLIVETKRPGALAGNREAVEAALGQARRYAAEQHVGCVAVSDGTMFYAADVVNGGLRDRVYCRLDAAKPPVDELWWVSTAAIYRPRSGAGSGTKLLPVARAGGFTGRSSVISDTLLHPKYRLPARCFAYVGDAARTGTWKLPFLCADGSIDTKRLPKAIQVILSNYRGAKVQKVPEEAIPDVLKRLAEAARSLGHMPPDAANPAPVYRLLSEALVQMGNHKPARTSRSQGRKSKGNSPRPRSLRSAEPNLDSFA